MCIIRRCRIMKELTCAAEWQAAAETACVPVYWGSSPRCLKKQWEQEWHYDFFYNIDDHSVICCCFFLKSSFSARGLTKSLWRLWTKSVGIRLGFGEDVNFESWPCTQSDKLPVRLLCQFTSRWDHHCPESTLLGLLIKRKNNKFELEAISKMLSFASPSVWLKLVWWRQLFFQNQ